MSQWESNWRQAFEDLKKDNEDSNEFGVNCWLSDADVVQYLGALEYLGASIELDIVCLESVRVRLPKTKSKCINILIHILTSRETPTEVLYDEENACLEMTWS